MMLPLALPLFAQDDCKLCGTWIGQWTDLLITDPNTDEYTPGTCKMYVQVKKYGQEYKIRIKYEYPSIDHVRYENDECSILDIAENSIHFKLTSSLLPNVGADDIITGYSNMERYYSLVYHNGYTHLTLNSQIQYEYDRRRVFRRKWDGLTVKVKTPDDDIDLFKDEEDW